MEPGVVKVGRGRREGLGVGRGGVAERWRQTSLVSGPWPANQLGSACCRPRHQVLQSLILVVVVDQEYLLNGLPLKAHFTKP